MTPGHRRRQAAGAARLFAAALAFPLAVMVTQPAAGVRVAEQNRWPGTVLPPATTAPSAQTVLINGDRVLATPSPSGPRVGAVVPAASAGLAGSVLGLNVAGKAYEIPGAALPYLGRGLSPALFELGALRRLETGGRLRVRVSYHGHLPALPGVTITGSGPSTAEGYLTVSSAAAFGAALDRQFAADHARGSYGDDGMFSGGVSVALAGAAAAPVAPAARPDYPMHTLTVTGTNLAGRPDTGDLAVVVSIDKGCPFCDPIETQNFFDKGAARFSVPSGHYFAIGDFYDLSAKGTLTAQRLTVLPQFTVSASTTVHAGERTADSKITVVTPRPATAQATTFDLQRPSPAGTLGYTWTDTVPIWVSPVHRRPAIGSLQVVTAQALGSPPARRSGYEYNIIHASARGIIPPMRYPLPSGRLATVHARYYQDVPSTGTAVNFATGPRFGFTFYYPLVLPGTHTLYLTGSRSIIWNLGYWQAAPPSLLHTSGGQFETDRIFPARDQASENWNTYPLHPAPNVSILGAANPVPSVTSASRSGDTLSIDITPFSDNQPGHTGAGFGADSRATVTGSYQIDQDGTKIAGGQATVSAEGFPLFVAQAKLRTQPSVIRFALNAARTGTAYRLSTAARTVWTWRSAREPGATLPRYWACASYWFNPLRGTRSCTVQPMITLRYRIRALALDGSVPPGRQVLGVTVGHLQLAKAAKVTSTTVAVSFNNGATWHDATMTGANGKYHAIFTAPAGSHVTLQVHAADAAGGSVTETITRGYKISR
jgi:hypothetical protein